MDKVLSSKQDNFVELIQMTDTHLFSNISKEFDGVNTFESLKSVINLAQQGKWPPDALLLTGDLVHDPTANAYNNLISIIENIEVPVICLPGNHDSPYLMRKMLNTGNISTDRIIIADNWIIIMLDTVIENSHSGRLPKNELKLLDQFLQLHSDKYCLICLHHPPVEVGSSWMDAMMLENSEDLFSIVDKYSNVKGLLWGHIHQEFDAKYNEILLMATPSTCVQFKPGTDRYTKDNKTAGYRIIRLFNDGKIETEISRL